MTNASLHTSSLGIDVGGSSIKLALLIPGSPAILEQSSSYSFPDAAAFESALHELTHRHPIRQAIATHPPASVGMCLPGVWNDSTGCLERSNNLPGLVGVPLRPLFDRALGTTLPAWTLSTDVHATAKDLWHEMAPHIPINSDQRPRRLFCLALGTGVGACVLDEGSLLRINGNSSGHFGQIDVTVSGSPPVAADGGVGTLEAYWAAAHVRQCMSHYSESTLPPALLNSLSRALRTAHAIYRPDCIVLAGGTSLRLVPHLDAIKSAMHQGLSSIARPHCGVCLASHAHHAAMGIARLALANGSSR